MYEKLLHESVIRIKDLCLSFMNLEQASSEASNTKAGEEAFSICVQMLSLLGSQSEGFKQLMKVSLEQIEIGSYSIEPEQPIIEKENQ